MPRYDSDKQAAPSKIVADAGYQTDGIERKEESCQTDGTKRQDFEVQVCSQQEVEAISTQTDSSIKCDFQVQANIPRESDSIAVQTIKEEIAMPNLPSSVAQTPAKKRKMSSVSTSGSISTNTAVIDLTMPQNPIPGESGDHLNHRQADVRLNSDRLNNKQAALDIEISNSEVYKIYCRNEDPKEAMKQIKSLETCLAFQQPTQPFPGEADFKRACEETLKKLWKLEPRLKDTKFVKIKKYIDPYTYDYALYRLDLEMDNILDTCFTRMQILIPNGYEFWYVANFERGISASKWFRVESPGEDSARYLAELNVMGITKATIDKFQYLHDVKKKSKKMSWFDFAYDAAEKICWKRYAGNLRVICDIVEANTDTTKEVNAAMQVQKYVKEFDSSNWITFKTYHGKSTRPLKKTRQPKNEKEIMEKEAKKAALIECSKERFGFDKFDDWCLDELGRPIEIEKHFEL